MDPLDRDVCYRALQTRDARFDGRIFVGVTSTGIYCRPVCPARTPKLEHCRFFASAAAAQDAGHRPCLRCRPETAPELGSWRGTSNTVSRALALIAEGGLDGGEASVDELAERLGVGGRQLRRLFQQHLGASPISVAQTRRVLFAKQLLHETGLPMAEVALASGFGSVRRFNEIFLELFGRPPSALRRKESLGRAADADVGVTLRLRYRAPYDWFAMLAHLEARAVRGVEVVEGSVYRRTLATGSKLGTVEVRNDASRQSLLVTLRLPNVQGLPEVLTRVRRTFDVHADIETITQHLAGDPMLAPLVALRPGLRAPGAWDGFELALRAILGQQVSVSAARTLLGRLVMMAGEALPKSSQSDARLTHAFPSPERVVAADLTTLGVPSSRRAAILAMSRAAIADPKLFQTCGSLEAAIARLGAIPGIGDWTAEYIALRALRETDAFPASDLGLLRAAENGVRPTPKELAKRAEPWRPWRAYAAQHLWAKDAANPSPRKVRHGSVTEVVRGSHQLARG